MKTQQRLQTHALLFLFLMVFTASCVGIFKKKEDDPGPQLAGTYQISTWTIVAGTVSDGGNSGTISVTGPTSNRINFTLSVPRYNAQDFNNVEVRKNGSSYDMYASDGSTKVGSLNGTDFNFDFQGNNQGQYIRLTVTAKK